MSFHFLGTTCINNIVLRSSLSKWFYLLVRKNLDVSMWREGGGRGAGSIAGAEGEKEEEEVAGGSGVWGVEGGRGRGETGGEGGGNEEEDTWVSRNKNTRKPRRSDRSKDCISIKWSRRGGHEKTFRENTERNSKREEIKKYYEEKQGQLCFPKAGGNFHTAYILNSMKSSLRKKTKK